ncbi:glycosyltransferase [Methylobacterium sp. J-092]|uniref:glycosyltransferase n=1 Tax=Methylobacterium sp. J-092 TaxID=2836667 RepID=UPI001FBA6E66|nr:glycosyltransferase [Methylobacterium sp. J-092]MCJ2007291.1 glycosyltransferase [Methylobacterium sp. J-092]
MAGSVTRAVAATLARHPRRTFAILWARLTGRRLRARQQCAALVGIDHRLALPPRILDRFPTELVPSDDPDLRLLTAPGHALVAGARRAFAAAFAADPSLHALYGDALVQASPGGPVFPLLRPAFDPDYLMAVDWLGPVLAVRRTSLCAIAGGDAEISALDAALRIVERFGPDAIGHLPGIVSVRIGPDLASDRASSLPPLRGRGPSEGGREREATDPATALPAPDPRSPEAHPLPLQGEGRRGPRDAHLETRLASLRRHLDRTGRAATRLACEPDGVVSALHPLPDPLPLVSVIVPTRDRVDLLRACLDGLRTRTDWPTLEILIADNDSRAPETLAYFRALEGEGVRVVACPGPFDFAGMNNAAAALARGALLAFVNNDVEAFRPDWLGRMVREALRPEIGAVGAKLLDGEGRIQHGGIVLGTGGLATHAHRHFPGDAPGDGMRLRATHAVSAVTAACLVVEAAKFRAVGGFDAAHFAVDFNDVDLCLRLNAAGHRTLMVPGAVLHHREGASRRRSPEAESRHAREVAAFKMRWGPLLVQDPHYHPGFDPDLSTHARLRAGAVDGPTGPGAVRRSGPSRSPT